MTETDKIQPTKSNEGQTQSPAIGTSVDILKGNWTSSTFNIETAQQAAKPQDNSSAGFLTGLVTGAGKNLWTMGTGAVSMALNPAGAIKDFGKLSQAVDQEGGTKQFVSKLGSQWVNSLTTGDAASRGEAWGGTLMTAGTLFLGGKGAVGGRTEAASSKTLSELVKASETRASMLSSATTGGVRIADTILDTGTAVIRKTPGVTEVTAAGVGRGETVLNTVVARGTTVGDDLLAQAGTSTAGRLGNFASHAEESLLNGVQKSGHTGLNASELLGQRTVPLGRTMAGQVDNVLTGAGAEVTHVAPVGSVVSNVERRAVGTASQHIDDLTSAAKSVVSRTEPVLAPTGKPLVRLEELVGTSAGNNASFGDRLAGMTRGTTANLTRQTDNLLSTGTSDVTSGASRAFSTVERQLGNETRALSRAVEQSWTKASPLTKMDDLIEATGGATRNQLKEVQQSLKAIDQAIKAGETPSAKLFDRAKVALESLDETAAGMHQQAVAEFKTTAMRTVSDTFEKSLQDVARHGDQILDLGGRSTGLLDDAANSATGAQGRVGTHADDVLAGANRQGRNLVDDAATTGRVGTHADDALSGVNRQGRSMLDDAQKVPRLVDDAAWQQTSSRMADDVKQLITKTEGTTQQQLQKVEQSLKALDDVVKAGGTPTKEMLENVQTALRTVDETAAGAGKQTINEFKQTALRSVEETMERQAPLRAVQAQEQAITAFNTTEKLLSRVEGTELQQVRKQMVEAMDDLSKANPTSFNQAAQKAENAAQRYSSFIEKQVEQKLITVEEGTKLTADVNKAVVRFTDEAATSAWQQQRTLIQNEVKTIVSAGGNAAESQVGQKATRLLDDLRLPPTQDSLVKIERSIKEFETAAQQAGLPKPALDSVRRTVTEGIETAVENKVAVRVLESKVAVADSFQNIERQLTTKVESLRQGGAAVAEDLVKAERQLGEFNQFKNQIGNQVEGITARQATQQTVRQGATQLEQETSRFNSWLETQARQGTIKLEAGTRETLDKSLRNIVSESEQVVGSRARLAASTAQNVTTVTEQAGTLARTTGEQTGRQLQDVQQALKKLDEFTTKGATAPKEVFDDVRSSLRRLDETAAGANSKVVTEFKQTVAQTVTEAFERQAPARAAQAEQDVLRSFQAGEKLVGQTRLPQLQQVQREMVEAMEDLSKVKPANFEQAAQKVETTAKRYASMLEEQVQQKAITAEEATQVSTNLSKSVTSLTEEAAATAWQQQRTLIQSDVRAIARSAAATEGKGLELTQKATQVIEELRLPPTSQNLQTIQRSLKEFEQVAERAGVPKPALENFTRTVSDGVENAISQRSVVRAIESKAGVADSFTQLERQVSAKVQTLRQGGASAAEDLAKAEGQLKELQQFKQTIGQHLDDMTSREIGADAFANRTSRLQQDAAKFNTWLDRQAEQGALQVDRGVRQTLDNSLRNVVAESEQAVASRTRVAVANAENVSARVSTVTEQAGTLAKVTGGETGRQLEQVQQSLRKLEEYTASGKVVPKEVFEEVQTGLRRIDDAAAGANTKTVNEFKQAATRTVTDAFEKQAPMRTLQAQQETMSALNVSERLITQNGQGLKTLETELTQLKQIRRDMVEALDDLSRAKPATFEQAAQRAETASQRYSSLLERQVKQNLLHADDATQLSTNVNRSIARMTEEASTRVWQQNRTVLETEIKNITQAATRGGETQAAQLGPKANQLLEDLRLPPTRENLGTVRQSIKEFSEAAEKAGIPQTTVKSFTRTAGDSIENVVGHESAARALQSKVAVSDSFTRVEQQLSSKAETLKQAGTIEAKTELAAVEQQMKELQQFRQQVTSRVDDITRRDVTPQRFSDSYRELQRDAGRYHQWLDKQVREGAIVLDEGANSAGKLRIDMPLRTVVNEAETAVSSRARNLTATTEGMLSRTTTVDEMIARKTQSVASGIEEGGTARSATQSLVGQTTGRVETEAGALSRSAEGKVDDLLKAGKTVAADNTASLERRVVAETETAVNAGGNKVDDLLKAGKTGVVDNTASLERRVVAETETAVNAGGNRVDDLLKAGKTGVVDNTASLERRVVAETETVVKAGGNKVDDLLKAGKTGVVDNTASLERRVVAETETTVNASGAKVEGLTTKASSATGQSEGIAARVNSAAGNVEGLTTKVGATGRAAEDLTGARNVLSGAENTMQRAEDAVSLTTNKTSKLVQAAERDAALAKQSKEFLESYKGIHEELAERSRVAVQTTGQDAKAAMRDVDRLIADNNKLLKGLDPADAAALKIDRSLFLQEIRSAQTAERMMITQEARQTLAQTAMESAQKTAATTTKTGVTQVEEGTGAAIAGRNQAVLHADNINYFAENLSNARTAAARKIWTQALDEEVKNLERITGTNKQVSEAVQTFKAAANDLNESRTALRWSNGLVDRLPGSVDGRLPSWLERFSGSGPIDYIRGMSTLDKTFTAIGALQVVNQYRNVVQFAEQQLAEREKSTRQSASTDGTRSGTDGTATTRQAPVSDREAQLPPPPQEKAAAVKPENAAAANNVSTNRQTADSTISVAPTRERQAVDTNVERTAVAAPREGQKIVAPVEPQVDSRSRATFAPAADAGQTGRQVERTAFVAPPLAGQVDRSASTSSSLSVSHSTGLGSPAGIERTAFTTPGTITGSNTERGAGTMQPLSVQGDPNALRPTVRASEPTLGSSHSAYLSSDLRINSQPPTYNQAIERNNKFNRGGGLMVQFAAFNKGYVAPPPPEEVAQVQIPQARFSFRTDNSEQFIERVTNRVFDYGRTRLDPSQIRRADSIGLSNQLLTPDARRTARMLNSNDNYATGQSLANKHLQFVVAAADSTKAAIKESAESLNPDRASGSAAGAQIMPTAYMQNQNDDEHGTGVAMNQLNDPSLTDPANAQNNQDDENKSNLSLTSLS